MAGEKDMDTIKASNVWDDDYIAPDEKDKLRGECAKLYMELRDIDVRLQDLTYRQTRCRQIYFVSIIVAVAILLIALMIGGVQLFYWMQPISGLKAIIVNGGIIISTLFAGIASVIFFSAMSVYPFWAWCANILRIDKLEIQRMGCVREKNAIEIRLEELDRIISKEAKTE